MDHDRDRDKRRRYDDDSSSYVNQGRGRERNFGRGRDERSDSRSGDDRVDLRSFLSNRREVGHSSGRDRTREDDYHSSSSYRSAGSDSRQDEYRSSSSYRPPGGDSRQSDHRPGYRPPGGDSRQGDYRPGYRPPGGDYRPSPGYRPPAGDSRQGDYRPSPGYRPPGGDSFQNRGGFRGGRGGGRGGFSGEPFHKTAGGDFQRMPDSIDHTNLVSQKLQPGTEGQPINLIGNFYRFLHSDIVVYHYDVAISKVRFSRPKKSDSSIDEQPLSGSSPQNEPSASTSDSKDKTKEIAPEEPNSEKQREAQDRFIKKFSDKIVASFAEAYPDVFAGVSYVYDGNKNIYSTNALTLTKAVDENVMEFQRKVEMMIDGRPATFLVNLKLADRVSLSDAVRFYNGDSSKAISERIISIFETIFRYVINQSYTPYQRKFFDLNEVEKSNKVKLCDFVQGFINSVRATEFGLAFNVHLKTSCIIAQSMTKLIDLVCCILNVSDRDLSRMPNKKQLFEVNKIIRHLRISTNHQTTQDENDNKIKKTVTYTIDRMIDRFPKDITFEDKKGVKTSLYDYFKTHYGIRLGEYPLIRCSGRGDVHLPLELCSLQPSQFLDKTKFDLNIQRELLTKSTHVPNVYFHTVAKIVKQIVKSDSTGMLKSFGIELNPKAIQFEGRVLAPPQNISSHIKDRFFKPAKSVKWALFVLDKQFHNRDLDNFEQKLCSTAARFGLPLPRTDFKECVDVRGYEDIRNLFVNIQKVSNADIVFVGVPQRHETLPSADIYGLVKHFCDQEFGLISQCFRAEVLRNEPRGYFDNLLLKVNGKIDGKNSSLHPDALKSLPFDPKRTMVVGVDVNHPGATERVVSSVAAAVGSYDESFSCFNTSIRVQMKERDEMVKQLDEMMIELLEQYYKVNKSYPKNVIVFRDGVSEGQFDKVLKIEIPLIEKAFEMTKKSKINLTLLVVQKRHHTRFALAQQDSSGRRPTYNVPSGTVVDKTIVDPQNASFYLNSHFSPLGTSKPTKYVILRDDLILTSDQVQKMCFFACFNCIRTRNVISIPLAVRYADLCAYRSKLHIEARRAMEDDRSSKSGRSNPAAGDTMDANYEESLIKGLNEKAKISDNLKHLLFYC